MISVVVKFENCQWNVTFVFARVTHANKFLLTISFSVSDKLNGLNVGQIM